MCMPIFSLLVSNPLVWQSDSQVRLDGMETPVVMRPIYVVPEFKTGMFTGANYKEADLG